MLVFLLCAARFTVGGSITEPGKSWASSALITAETASLGGVKGGVMKRGVVFGVGGMTSEGWMKNPGAATGLEGTELWTGPTADAAAAAAAVVWCSFASSLAFCGINGAVNVANNSGCEHRSSIEIQVQFALWARFNFHTFNIGMLATYYKLKNKTVFNLTSLAEEHE